MSLNDFNEDLFDILKENLDRKNNTNDTNNTNDLKEEVEVPDDYCLNCDSDSICNIKGELICTKCGFFKGINIENTAEWRFYGSEDSKNSDPNRCGMPTSQLLPEFSMGSVIPFKRNESYGMRKIRNFNTWNNTSYRERSLYQVFEQMTIRAKNNGIPSCIIEEAKYMYKMISETKISRGKNRVGIIASCIYMACKFKNSARSTKEIADIFQIEPTSMTKGFKKFNEIMLLVDKEKKKNIHCNISESSDFVHRFCSNLNLEKDVYDLCKHVCNKIEEYDLVSENTPTSKAAGAIYLVVYLFNLEISKKDISTICLTSEVTINKCFIKLIEYYIHLLPISMLKYLAIHLIHKFSENIKKFFNQNKFKLFLKKSLEEFERIVKLNLIKDEKYITHLAAGILNKQLEKFAFSNINIKDISNTFHITVKNIDKYSKLVKNK